MPDKPSILVISNDNQTFAALSRPFADDVTFIRADSVRRAASQAKLSSPSAIILDDSLVGADWLEVYRELWKELSYTFVPILLLTEAANADYVVSKLDFGLVDVLVKPVEPAQIKARVRAMLQVKAVHDQLDSEKHLLQKKLDEERRVREQLTAINEELKKLSTTDGLTGMANYRYLRTWLSTEFEIASRYKMPLSAIMIDLDEFKPVNDRYGHPFGDYILKSVAKMIMEKSRRADFTARYGGDEFAVVLPNTDGKGAMNLARRIHSAIEKQVYEHGQSVKVTASLGLAAFPCERIKSAEELIDAADRALYAAKSKGRNCIVTCDELA